MSDDFQKSKIAEKSDEIVEKTEKSMDDRYSLKDFDALLIDLMKFCQLGDTKVDFLTLCHRICMLKTHFFRKIC